MIDYIKRVDALKAATLAELDADFVIEVLHRIPAADVRPVVHARWTDHRTIEHDGEWWCTACGNEVAICSCGKDKTWKYQFCPNCGADMRPSEEPENLTYIPPEKRSEVDDG